MPALPGAQRDAFSRLRYGRATKTLLRFDRHSWRRPGAPRACATDLELGAVWDGSEDQHGRRGILTLLAGGGASDATKAILNAGGPQQLVQRLGFFKIGRAQLIGAQSFTWDDDPWARGAYGSLILRFCRHCVAGSGFPGDGSFLPENTRASHGKAI